MTTYTLTTGNDAPGSTAGADTYDGALGGQPGGTDTLNGGAGNDIFQIVGGSAGTITGGADTDTVEIYGDNLGTTTFSTVEVLNFANYNLLYATASQLNSFSSIISTANPDSQLQFYLTGAGGTFDFSTKVTGGYSVYIQGANATAAYSVTGSGNADTLNGAGFNDTLNGGGGADTIAGGAGNDSLNGGAGADEIHTGEGTDTVNGGDDADTIYVESDGTATINGDAGNDIIYNTHEAQAGTITGGAGTDTFVAIYGIIYPLTFNTMEVLDVASGGVNVTAAQLSSFSSIINSNNVNSQLQFNLIGVGGTIDFSTRVTGGYSIYVTDGNLTAAYSATGTANADSLNGSGFNDTLSGGGGADYLDGGAGNDTLNGGAGTDTIYTGAGTDTVNGGDDADSIFVYSDGTATINGDNGNDGIYLQNSGQAGTITGGAGTDTLYTGTDLGTLTFNTMEVLDLTNGTVTATAAQLNSFSSIINSNNINSQLQFNLIGAGGTIDFSTRVTGGYSVYVTDAGVTTGYSVTGSANADSLNGSGFNDTLNGGGGADYIAGGAGSDSLNGGAGNDEIHTGGTGSDTVNGGDNDDSIYIESDGPLTINGDGGNDIFYLFTTDAATGTINGGAGTDTLYAGGLTQMTFSGMEVLDLFQGGLGGGGSVAQLNSFSSIINSNNPNSQIAFNLIGAGGTLDLSTKLTAGYSAYVYDQSVTSGYSVTGTGNADSLNGSGFNDTLNGGGGADYIAGGAGSDSLNGGAGNDEIHTGGTGSDTVNGGDNDDSIYIESDGPLTINGDGGNDIFYLFTTDAATGTINGGAGTDTLYAGGLTQMTFSGMEVLDLFQGGLGGGGSVAQLNSFSSIINSNNPNSQLSLNLIGAGGTIDFSTKLTAGYSVYVYNQSVTSGYSVTGTANADSLNGSGFNDTLNGGAGDDTIDGGGGINTASYAGSAAGVTVDLTLQGGAQNTVGAGNDTLSNIQNLIGSSSGDKLTGDDNDNVLNGGAGADTMVGNLGNDTYVVDVAGDVVTEAAGAGSGIDTIQTALATYSIAALANIENLTGTSGTGQSLTGNGNNNTINAAGGNDTLNGGAGADTMAGGLGNDTYVVDDAGDVVDESVAGSGGTADLVQSTVSVNLNDAVHFKGAIENVTLLGAAASAIGNGLANRLTGNDGANVLNGGVGADTMVGGLGNDVYYVDNSSDFITEDAVAGSGIDTVNTTANFDLNLRGANVETIIATAAGLMLTGNASANSLYDFATGAVGTTMAGGGGDDNYYIRNAATSVSEVAGQGTDTVYVSVNNYTLGATFERIVANAAGLTINGNGAINSLYDFATGAGTTMAGGEGADTYYVRNKLSTVSEGAAASGIDTVYAFADYTLDANVEQLIANAAGLKITGNASANALVDWAASGSTMAGKDGNDTYYVRNSNSFVDESLTGGADTVYASADFDLGVRGANVETIIANAAGLKITGNASANSLFDFAAGAGASMKGGVGDDTYYVRNANSTVSEVAGQGTDTVYVSVNNYTLGSDLERIGANVAGLTINGNGVANSLYDFATGAGTTMAGGDGGDTYYVRNKLTTVSEGAAGSGIDTVYANVDHTLGDNVEQIVASATGLTVGGNGAANTLLDWAATGSTMAGGGGDDSYYVRNANSLISNEAVAGGTDTVYASADFDLSQRGTNVEGLRAATSGNIALTGNTLSNTIVGGAGNNTLAGGLGLDTLTGGAGADTFVFNTAANAANFDVITDFSHADDTISLSKAVFAALTGAAGAGIDPSQFNAVLSSAAYEANDRIIYQTDTGKLLYDVDGFGAGTQAAVQIALLTTKPQNVDATDFLLVA